MDCHPQTNPWAACDRKNIDRECLAARRSIPRLIFPVCVFGSSLTNSTAREYL